MLPIAPDSRNFVLKVRGDSMLTHNIVDGDFVIVQRTNQAAVGDLVMTRDVNGVPSLQCFNGEQTVEGVLIGLMRRF
jgi:phage repressor protein C with HTH and peptisase S24 domain